MRIRIIATICLGTMAGLCSRREWRNPARRNRRQKQSSHPIPSPNQRVRRVMETSYNRPYSFLHSGEDFVKREVRWYDNHLRPLRKGHRSHSLDAAVDLVSAHIGLARQRGLYWDVQLDDEIRTHAIGGPVDVQFPPGNRSKPAPARLAEYLHKRTVIESVNLRLRVAIRDHDHPAVRGAPYFLELVALLICEDDAPQQASGNEGKPSRSMVLKTTKILVAESIQRIKKCMQSYGLKKNRSAWNLFQ